MPLYIRLIHMHRIYYLKWSLCSDLIVCFKCDVCQTWNLSKILHTQIFRLKVLHRKNATFFSQINSVNASNSNRLGIFGL